MNIDFYKILNSLKHTKRKGWLEKGLNADTISAHIFAAMYIGRSIAIEEGANENKVINMLLFHDLVMSKMEDVTPASTKYKNKSEIEEVSKLKVSGLMSKRESKYYLDIFSEFKSMNTLESQIARESDKIETLLQGDSFEEETGNANILDDFLETYKEIFKTKTGLRYFSEIKKRHDTRKIDG